MNALMTLSQQFPTLYFIAIGCYGLMIGSFLNVVIYRLPIMLDRQWQLEYQHILHPNKPVTAHPTFNLMLPGSTCPQCGHKITIAENIPVLSWMLLRGRCSCCKARISIRYPLVELATLVLSLAVAWKLPAGVLMLGALLLTWTLICLALIDLDKLLLPDQITLPLLWMGLLFNLEGGFATLEDAVIGAMAGYLVLWGLFWAFKLIRGKEGMGYGDFKLLSALGAWLGVQSLPSIVLIASVVGLLVSVGRLIQKRVSNVVLDEQDNIFPFGPYLALGGWLTMLWGNIFSLLA